MVDSSHLQIQEIKNPRTEQDIKVGGIYEHYKGKLYKVLCVSCNADDLTHWVVYEALYDNKVSKIWHRKVEDFLEVGV